MKPVLIVLALITAGIEKEPPPPAIKPPEKPPSPPFALSVPYPSNTFEITIKLPPAPPPDPLIPASPSLDTNPSMIEIFENIRIDPPPALPMESLK